MGKDRGRFYQIGLLQFAWLILHLQFVDHAVVRSNDFGDLILAVGVADNNAREGIFESFVSDPRTLEKGKNHAIPCRGAAV